MGEAPLRQKMLKHPQRTPDPPANLSLQARAIRHPRQSVQDSWVPVREVLTSPCTCGVLLLLALVVLRKTSAVFASSRNVRTCSLHHWYTGIVSSFQLEKTVRLPAFMGVSCIVILRAEDKATASCSLSGVLPHSAPRPSSWPPRRLLCDGVRSGLGNCVCF